MKLLRITTVPISLKLLLRGQLSYFKQNGFDVLAVSADGPEVASLAQEGIRHEVVSMTRKITPWRDFVTLIQLIRVIRKFKPDIVHTHTPKAGLLGMMAAKFCNVRVRIHTVAGLPLMEAKGFKRRILLLTEKLTYACATKVYPNSVGLQSYISINIQTRTPLKVIGRGSSNGIDSEFFRPTEVLKHEGQNLRSKYHIPDGVITFCFVGRVVKDKGINELLEAFDLFSKKYSSRLLLVGPFEDDLDPVSDQSRKILSENKNVLALGFLNDVRPALMACDIFVFPSYREGFPNVVLQACCLERASIVSDINGCNEIITHNETGLLVKPKNVPMLLEAMEKLSVNPDLKQQLAVQARKNVVQNFEQRYIWDEWLKEYRNLAGEK